MNAALLTPGNIMRIALMSIVFTLFYKFTIGKINNGTTE